MSPIINGRRPDHYFIKTNQFFKRLYRLNQQWFAIRNPWHDYRRDLLPVIESVIPILDQLEKLMVRYGDTPERPSEADTGKERPRG